MLSHLTLGLLAFLLTLSRSVSTSSSSIPSFREALGNQASIAAAAAVRSTTTNLQYIGIQAELSHPTLSATTDPGSACPGSTATHDAASFLRGGLSSLSTDLMGPLGSYVGGSSSSEEVAQDVAQHFPPAFARGLSAGGAIMGFEGGLGAGFGYELYCEGKLLLALGGGGGGCVSWQGGRRVGGLGGGGGAQTDLDGVTVSAGGGTGCRFVDGDPMGCRPTADGGGESFAVIKEKIQAVLSSCGSGLIVCGGGGGGGGFSYSSPVSCHYGGGFDFTFSGVATAVADETLNATEVERRREELREEAAIVCPTDRYDRITSSAARACNAQCAGKPSYYNSCYCPCFKNHIENAGLSWGYTMACAN